MTKFFKILFLSIFAFGGVLKSNAEEDVLYPTVEWHYRTKTNDANNPTGWDNDNDYPKEVSSNSETLECNSVAQIFVLQQFDFTEVDFSKIKSLKLSYTRGSYHQGTELGAWIFGSNDWGTTDNNTWSDTWKSNISNALGVNIGSAGTVRTPIFYSNRGNTTAYTQEFSREQIQQLQSGLSDGKLNLLVTSVYKEDEEHYYVSSKKVDNSERNLRTDICNYLSEDKAKIEIEYYDYTHPNLELGLRPKQGDNTGWDAFKVGKDNTNLEIRTGARLVAIEQLVIKDLQKNKKYSLVLSKDGQPGDLKAFKFPYPLPASNSVSNEEFKSQLKAVAGIDYTGASSVAVEFKPGIGDFKCENNKWTITFLGSDVTAVSTDENGNSIVNLLLCTKDNPTSSDGPQAHIATMGNADESKRPVVAEMECSVINRNQNIGYASLKEAVDAAVSGDVLEVVNDVELSGRIDTGGRNLLIKGATENVKITRSSSYKGLMFLTTNDDGAALSVKNLTIDGGGIEVAAAVFESSNGKNLNIENVTIQNVNSTQDLGAAISNKNSGTLVLDNVTFKNCVCKGNTPSVLFVGTNTVTLKNNVSFENCGDVPNVRIENMYFLNAENLENTTPITLDLGNHSSDSGSTIVKNCSNNKKFALYHSYDFLEVDNNGKLILKHYELVNTTKTPMLGYNNLTDAINESEDGDIIEIRYDVTTPSDRIDVNKSIVLKGVNGAVVMNGTSDNNMILLSQTATGVTLEDIIIDGQGKNRNDVATLEAGSGFKLILRNVEIRNLISGRDVTVNGTLDLYGNNVLPNGIRLNRYKNITDHNTTHTTPISFSLAHDFAEQGTIVEGCDDASKYLAKKQVSKDDTNNFYEWKVYCQDGNLRAKSYDEYDLNVSNAGAATLVLPFDAEIPRDLEAYTLNFENEKVKATPVTNILPKNTPVYVKANQGTYHFVLSNNGSQGYEVNPQSGILYGTYSRKNVAKDDYFLSWTNSDPKTTGFYKVSNEKTKYVSPFRAYLHIDSPTNARETIIIDFGETTGVENIDGLKDLKSAKSLENGRIVILKGGRRYNTAGQVIK